MKNLIDKTESQTNYFNAFVLANRHEITKREFQALHRCERSTGYGQ
jgi:hypothetical protein